MRVHALVLYVPSDCARNSHLKKITLKCLCEDTSFIGMVSIKTGGWCGLMRFLKKIIDSDFAGLKITNHLFAHWCIFSISEFS